MLDKLWLIALITGALLCLFGSMTERTVLLVAGTVMVMVMAVLIWTLEIDFLKPWMA